MDRIISYFVDIFCSICISILTQSVGFRKVILVLCVCKTFRYKVFLEYNDIDPDFKEKNRMSRNDTGIDCCDMDDTIVQCKLRTVSLTLKECSTFFASQTMVVIFMMIRKRLLFVVIILLTVLPHHFVTLRKLRI